MEIKTKTKTGAEVILSTSPEGIRAETHNAKLGKIELLHPRWSAYNGEWGVFENMWIGKGKNLRKINVLLMVPKSDWDLHPGSSS